MVRGLLKAEDHCACQIPESGFKWAYWGSQDIMSLITPSVAGKKQLRFLLVTIAVSELF